MFSSQELKKELIQCLFVLCQAGGYAISKVSRQGCCFDRRLVLLFVFFCGKLGCAEWKKKSNVIAKMMRN